MLQSLNTKRIHSITLKDGTERLISLRNDPEWQYFMTLTGEFALEDHRLLVGGDNLVSERDGYLRSYKTLFQHRFGFHCKTQYRTNSIQHVEQRHHCIHDFININSSSLLSYGKCFLF